MKDEVWKKILKCGMVYYNNGRPEIKKAFSEIFTNETQTQDSKLSFSAVPAVLSELWAVAAELLYKSFELSCSAVSAT